VGLFVPINQVTLAPAPAAPDPCAAITTELALANEMIARFQRVDDPIP
jgi:hypothetical protein